MSEYLSTEFKIPEDDFTLGFLGTTTSTKWFTEHNEERTYDYRLYTATVSVLPADWRLDGEFIVGSKRCRWMTLDDMRNDPKIYEINSDVIQMLGDRI